MFLKLTSEEEDFLKSQTGQTDFVATKEKNIGFVLVNLYNK